MKRWVLARERVAVQDDQDDQGQSKGSSDQSFYDGHLSYELCKGRLFRVGQSTTTQCKKDCSAHRRRDQQWKSSDLFNLCLVSALMRCVPKMERSGDSTVCGMFGCAERDYKTLHLRNLVWKMLKMIFAPSYLFLICCSKSSTYRSYNLTIRVTCCCI